MIMLRMSTIHITSDQSLVCLERENEMLLNQKPEFHMDSLNIAKNITKNHYLLSNSEHLVSVSTFPCTLEVHSVPSSRSSVKILNRT